MISRMKLVGLKVSSPRLVDPVYADIMKRGGSAKGEPMSDNIWPYSHTYIMNGTVILNASNCLNKHGDLESKFQLRGVRDRSCRVRPYVGKQGHVIPNARCMTSDIALPVGVLS